MRAYVLSGYGGPAKASLQDVARPAPGPGEVLVRVRAAGLNPVDFKTRDGMLKPVLTFDLPVVMGNELAGVIEACGADTARFQPGDRVFARVGKERMGAFAEYAVVAGEHCAAIPDDLDFETAAAIPLAGLTALQALRDELRVKPGFRLFISGGAGGVGTFAIQLAKALGGHVITTASPRGRDLVESLGADEVVDYTTHKFEDVVQPVDGAFDLIGGDTLSRTFGIVKPGGRVVSVGGMPEPRTARQDLGRGFGLAALFWAASFKFRMQAKKAGVDYRYLFMHPSGAELAELGALAQEGQLKPVIDSCWPFAQIEEAMEKLEGGHAKGKIVVAMEGS